MLASWESARSLELRAAISLTRAFPTAEHRSLLAECVGRFTEGFDTHDLKLAQELLAGS